MSEVVNELISFHGGVSQQDVSLRLAQQVEESTNCYHTIDSGLRRRNPVELINDNTGVSANCWTYSYDRGLAGELNEKYTVVYDESGLKVIDLNTGLAVTVVDNSAGYLEPFSSDTGYSASTVKDVTFITNRNKVVEMTTATTGAITDEAFVWVKRADPIDGYEYYVTVNGTKYEVKYSPVDPAEPTDEEKKALTTTGVAELMSGKIPNSVFDGNIIKITSVTSIFTSDSYGDKAIGYIFNTVPTEEDLPSSMPYNTIVEVGGQNNSDATYWLTSIDSRWAETVGKDTLTTLDASTMPHKLVREANGSFTFGPIVWNSREVGDEDNSKKPSFVGTGITDIFFFKNRLGLLTPNSILFSEVREYYNFWKTTQVTELDSERIDIDIDAKKAIRLHYVEFLQNDLIIFGDKSQFSIVHEGSLTARTISATLISEYDYNTRVQPVAIDNKIFFMALNHNYNTVYIFRKDRLEDSVSSADSITMHIPRYIDADISQIVGSSVNNVLFFKSKTETNTLYVYKYLDDVGKLIQSSWFKWQFQSDIHSVFTTEDRLFILGTWEGTSSLGSLVIAPQPITESFLDGGISNFESTVTLSEYLPSIQGQTRISDKVNLKTVYVKANYDSIFELKILNTTRNHERVIGSQYVLGRKPYIMGKAKDTRLTIINKEDNGFEINGVAYESRLNNRSNTI